VPSIRGYAGLVSEVSEGGMRLLAEIVQDRLNGPQVLYDAWADGQISDCDLRSLIPDTWLYLDWPERVIGTGKWVRLFRAAGFLSIPYGLSRPDSAMTVFRVRLRSAGQGCPGPRTLGVLISSVSGIRGMRRRPFTGRWSRPTRCSHFWSAEERVRRRSSWIRGCSLPRNKPDYFTRSASAMTDDVRATNEVPRLVDITKCVV
jgi:hypothetical protein